MNRFKIKFFAESLIAVLVFLFVFVSFSTNVHAQGWYTCQVSDDGLSCVNLDYNCEAGYEGTCIGKNPCLESYTYLCSQITPQSESLDLNDLYNTIQPPGSNPLFRMTSYTTSSNIGLLINAVNLIVFPLAGLVLLLYLIYGGYNMMLSGGDPKKAAAAKSIITTALIGFVIIFLSYWIVQIVGSILGLDFSSIF